MTLSNQSTQAKPTQKQKVEALMQRLQDGVAKIATSEEWQRWLKTASKFHRYSPRNGLLICLQRPDATRVAGFKTWLSLDRCVRKGERGIAILAPILRKLEPDDAQKSIVGFRTVHVFDVAQTDGEPLPTPSNFARRLEGRGDQYLEAYLALEQHAHEDLDFDIELRALGGEPNGYMVPVDRRIVIDARLSEQHRVKTLCHELGHAHLHVGKTDYGRERQEVEAESVAFCVMNALGFDSSEYTFGYVAGWAAGDSEVIAQALQNVHRATAKILAAIDPEPEAEA